MYGWTNTESHHYIHSCRDFALGRHVAVTWIHFTPGTLEDHSPDTALTFIFGVLFSCHLHMEPSLSLGAKWVRIVVIAVARKISEHSCSGLTVVVVDVDLFRSGQEEDVALQRCLGRDCLVFSTRA